MIDIGMYAALGFLVASLLALLLTPPLWNRAVRLTTRQLEATMPMSVAEIQADKDQLRAEFAIELRRVEVALEKAKDKAARELMEANKRRVRIAEITAELAAAKAGLDESQNANRVLEQTIKRRLPDMESRVKASKELMAELEQANAEFRNSLVSQSDALKRARATVQAQRSEIEQLRAALDGGAGAMRGKSDARLAKEVQQLNAELSRARQELEGSRANGQDNEALRRELMQLSSQILAAAKGQPIPVGDLLAPRREVRDIAEVVAAYKRQPDRHEEVAPPPQALNGSKGGDAMPAEEAPAGHSDETEVPAEAGTSGVPDVTVEAGEERTASEESIEEQAASMEAADPQAVAIAVDEEQMPSLPMHEAAPAIENGHGQPLSQEEPGSDSEAKQDLAVHDESSPGSLAKRFASRRATRRGSKGRGRSLGDRLRGMPAEAEASES